MDQEDKTTKISPHAKIFWTKIKSSTSEAQITFENLPTYLLKPKWANAKIKFGSVCVCVYECILYDKLYKKSTKLRYFLLAMHNLMDSHLLYENVIQKKRCYFWLSTSNYFFLFWPVHMPFFCCYEIGIT